jgi:hypothetical protein
MNDYYNFKKAPLRVCWGSKYGSWQQLRYGVWRGYDYETKTQTSRHSVPAQFIKTSLIILSVISTDFRRLIRKKCSCHNFLPTIHGIVQYHTLNTIPALFLYGVVRVRLECPNVRWWCSKVFVSSVQESASALKMTRSGINMHVVTSVHHGLIDLDWCNAWCMGLPGQDDNNNAGATNKSIQFTPWSLCYHQLRPSKLPEIKTRRLLSASIRTLIQLPLLRVARYRRAMISKKANIRRQTLIWSKRKVNSLCPRVSQ